MIREITITIPTPLFWKVGLDADGMLAATLTFDAPQDLRAFAEAMFAAWKDEGE